MPTSEQPKLGNYTPDDVDKGGGEHVANTVQKRKDHAVDVLPSTPTKEAVLAASDSTLTTPAEKESGRKILDPVLDHVGSPSGTAYMQIAANEFKNIMDTNQQARDSVFFQAAYHYCNLFANILGFSMTASMYSEYIDSFHSGVAFTENEVTTLVDNRKKMELVHKYVKTKAELAQTTDPVKKSELEKTLKDTKDELVKVLGTSGEDPDKLIKEFSDKIKEPVPQPKIEELKKKSKADARISTCYVYQQLGIPAPVSGEYDSDILCAQLSHTAYEETPSDKLKEEKRFYTKVENPAFKTSVDTNALVPGTVIFFNKTVNDVSVMMCGYVGIDGEIRYYDSTGLHTFGAGVDKEKLVAETLGENPQPIVRDADVDTLELFGGGNDIISSTPFKMAFVPQTTLIYKEEAPEAPEAAATPASPQAPASPAKPEVKAETPQS